MLIVIAGVCLNQIIVEFTGNTTELSTVYLVHER